MFFRVLISKHMLNCNKCCQTSDMLFIWNQQPAISFKESKRISNRDSYMTFHMPLVEGHFTSYSEEERPHDEAMCRELQETCQIILELLSLGEVRWLKVVKSRISSEIPFFYMKLAFEKEYKIPQNSNVLFLTLFVFRSCSGLDLDSFTKVDSLQRFCKEFPRL